MHAISSWDAKERSNTKADGGLNIFLKYFFDEELTTHCNARLLGSENN
jgi:hypothetical protein